MITLLFAQDHIKRPHFEPDPTRPVAMARPGLIFWVNVPVQITRLLASPSTPRAMSHLNAFGQHLKANPDLQAQLRQAETEGALIERVLAEAEALGYSLSADEVRQRLAANQESRELSEAELDTATGGTNVFSKGVGCDPTLRITCIWPC